MRTPLAVLAVSLLAASCASMTTSYSEVIGERYNLAPENRRAVDIVSVGGTSGWANGSAVQVDPGVQRVVVTSRAHRGFRGRTAEFQLNVEPCTRYYINAQFDTTITQQWTPVIDYVDTIAGCQVTPAKS